MSSTPTSSQSPPEPAITSKSKSISTETLLQIQKGIQKQQESKGWMYKSRAVVRRLSQQKEELVQLAKTIHHGSKQDFLSALAHSVTTSTCSSSNSLIQDEDWDGSLTPQDILALAKKAHDPQKRMTVYDTIIVESAPYHYHLIASDVWQINPQRLRETLQYLYWWLPEREWWKIYGNGRNFGGKDSVALTLNTVNDEAMFNGVAYHSPEEYWPITIFYGKDKTES